VTAADALFAEQRQQYVLQQLLTRGRVQVRALADELAVSTESVRKDLVLLESRGLLRRVHGGAIPAQHLSFEPEIEQRTSCTDEKLAIAQAALAHAPEGSSILLDAGSTVAQLAALLPTDRSLTVFTNALPTALPLLDHPSVTLYIFGGRVRRTTSAAVGQLTLDALNSINVDVAFLGTNGISLTRGLTTPDEQEASVKRNMLRTAQRRIFLADHSKFGRESLYQHAVVSDIDLLITDIGTPKRHLEALAKADVDVEVVRVKP
jgi:DeoR family transcriptional regulator, fructose operon transcriptional repressor